MVAWEKKHKNVSFYGVCMYVRPKLTFVSFFMSFFFAPFPKRKMAAGSILAGKIQGSTGLSLPPAASQSFLGLFIGGRLNIQWPPPYL